MIDSARNSVVTIYTENCSAWISYAKKSMVGVFHMLSRFLPEWVQMWTEPFFKKILASYDSTLAASKAMESSTDLSDTGAYMRQQK